MILQSQVPALRPLTTAHLAQTMTLLELNGDELRQKIEAELASNPALEQVDEHRCPGCGRAIAKPGTCPFCSHPSDLNPEQPLIFVSPYTDYTEYRKKGTSVDQDAEDWQTTPEDLPTYVLRQVALELAPEDRPIAAHILTSLDDDGLLRIPLFEIARYHHITLSRVEHVIHIIQHAEPIGVGSSTPQEALLIQLDVLAETNPTHPLARRIILEGMDLLSRRAFNELGRILGISPADVQRLADFISENLNPYPARAHWGDIHYGGQQNHLYLTPDIVISKLDSKDEAPLIVEVLSPYAGTLRVNPLFREAIDQAPPDKVESWQAAVDQASLLVKCMQQRDHTIMRLMQTLVKIQRKFILEGDAFLIPITRASMAEELEVHESTVSRAVSGKAVQLPNKRIILLDKFFDRSLQVRTALRDLIAKETRPMSDTEIANKLAKLGYPVARRTVAKYRSMEGILPARFRQPQSTQTVS
jgi:RNA polymerase sigma-54 factor